jgi:hypothetical protein
MEAISFRVLVASFHLGRRAALVRVVMREGPKSFGVVTEGKIGIYLKSTLL